MPLTVSLYLLLLGVVALLRLLELGISRRNQRLLAAQGATRSPEPGFRWMVLLHIGVLISAAAEVVFLKRPFLPPLALLMGLLLACAVGLRWWVIRVMGRHWNVQIVASTKLEVVTRGPYRWVRHPNYVAVFVEMLALPLLHTAWITATVGTVLHCWILRQRIRAEEAVLLSDPGYVAAMAWKPRFVPRIFGGSLKPAGERLQPKS